MCVYCSFEFNIDISIINCMSAHNMRTNNWRKWFLITQSELYGSIVRQSDRCDLSHPPIFVLFLFGFVLFYFVLLESVIFFELCDQFPKMTTKKISHILLHLNHLAFEFAYVCYPFFEISIYCCFCNAFFLLLHFFNWNLPLAYTGFDINNSPALRTLTANKSTGKNPWISHINLLLHFCCCGCCRVPKPGIEEERKKTTTTFRLCNNKNNNNNNNQKPNEINE